MRQTFEFFFAVSAVLQNRRKDKFRIYNIHFILKKEKCFIDHWSSLNVTGRNEKMSEDAMKRKL